MMVRHQTPQRGAHTGPRLASTLVGVLALVVVVALGLTANFGPLAGAAPDMGKPDSPDQSPTDTTNPTPEKSPESRPHRSPTDVAISGDGRWLLTANHTADSASLIDLGEPTQPQEAGRVVAEVAVGHKPFCVAMAPNGRGALVSNTWSGTISVLSWGPTGSDLAVTSTIAVGPQPRGVVYSADGRRAFVVCAAADSVVCVDLVTGRVVKSAGAGRRPWHVALSPDGRTLAVAASQSADMHFLMADETLTAVRVVRTTGDHLRRVAWQPDGAFAHVSHIYTRGFSTTASNIGRGWVVANHISRVSPVKGGRQAIALDVNTKAVGDADGLAFSPDGSCLAVAAGGTHELLLLATANIPWIEFGGPDDFIDDQLLRDQRFRRVVFDGPSRPLAVVFSPNGRTAWVADYLADAVRAVDVATASPRGLITLGGPANLSEARRGEILFSEARLSHHQWYSCHTCHAWGHTVRISFDTFNDKRAGNAKDTPTLIGVTQTGPWTWHGWQTDLTEAMARSVRESMQGPAISKTDAAALVAYLDGLTAPPNPHRGPDGQLTQAGLRGRRVFRSAKANCVRCHSGEDLTDGLIHDVGTGDRRDALPGYNTPSLRQVYDTAPYLHDGRAHDLHNLLTRHHKPEKLGGTGSPLTDQELSDLIAYLLQI